MTNCFIFMRLKKIKKLCFGFLSLVKVHLSAICASAAGKKMKLQARRYSGEHVLRHFKLHGSFFFKCTIC